jgi:hypothetical protein
MSEDMIKLVRATGTTQTLYLMNCSIYNNNKGGSWLSKSKDAMNPYFGGKRTDCADLKEEISPG